MKKRIIPAVVLFVAIVSCSPRGPQQNTQIKYGGIAIRFQLDEKAWRINSKKIEPAIAFVVYSGPDMTSLKYNRQVNPNIGIVMEKVGANVDPAAYFTSKRAFAGITGNLIAVYSGKEKFMKIPDSVGCLGKLENPEGIILNRMLITAIYNDYGIMILCDAVEDTYPDIEEDLKDVIRSMTFHTYEKKVK
jgi:hypothetical protein